MKNITIAGAPHGDVQDWYHEIQNERQITGAEIRRLHACPYCRRMAAFADISEFENDGDYWLACAACGVEWNISEEAVEVLDRLGLTSREEKVSRDL